MTVSMGRQAILDAVRASGVVGEGGAGFPAHVKYDAQVDTVIANGCECEPLLHTDQHIMRAHAAEVVRGLQAVMVVAGAKAGVIGIKRKYTAISSEFSRLLAGSATLRLAELDNFYPAGDEQVLVREVTGRTVPPLGLPKDVGAMVANVGSLAAVSAALDGRPVTHKHVTVTGEVARPAVIRVPLGTSVRDCLAACGGVIVSDPVYILGGPMMGRFVDDASALDRAVITKTGGGIIVLPRGHHLHRMASESARVIQRRAAVACIQCRYCTDMCPRHLIGHGFETHKVMRAFGAGKDAAMGSVQAHLCSECGVCELFSCPMGLSPRRVNAMVKGALREAGVAYAGSREVKETQIQLRPWRKVPVPGLARRIGIEPYMSLHPEYTGELASTKVSIPLRQHIGVSAEPVVAVGDAVRVGDCLGKVPEGKLGAAVHASISGTVIAVADSVIIKGA